MADRKISASAALQHLEISLQKPQSSELALPMRVADQAAAPHQPHLSKFLVDMGSHH